MYVLLIRCAPDRNSSSPACLECTSADVEVDTEADADVMLTTASAYGMGVT